MKSKHSCRQQGRIAHANTLCPSRTSTNASVPGERINTSWVRNLKALSFWRSGNHPSCLSVKRAESNDEAGSVFCRVVPGSFQIRSRRNQRILDIGFAGHDAVAPLVKTLRMVAGLGNLCQSFEVPQVLASLGFDLITSP
jgi:hypothetical protein